MSENPISKAHHRSPSYPALDLEHAIELAQKFHEHAKRTVVPAQHAASYWGFSLSSSGWRLALAALKQYGLLESAGSKKSGEAKLTDLALKIILDKRPSSAERDEAVRQAALAPEIYREVWAHWGGKVPDDDTFRTYLTLHKGFNENSVSGFISDFKKTVSFAKPAVLDTIRPAGDSGRSTTNDVDADDEEEHAARGSQERQQRRRPVQPGIKEDVFTLDEGQVVLQWPERLSKESFEDFESWLQLIIRKAKRTIQEPIKYSNWSDVAKRRRELRLDNGPDFCPEADLEDDPKNDDEPQ